MGGERFSPRDGRLKANHDERVTALDPPAPLPISESMTKPIHVVGGGLAGSEAAWQIANAGVPVVLHEMRPVRSTDAHKTGGLAELVCSNSFRSDDPMGNAVGHTTHQLLQRTIYVRQRTPDTRMADPQTCRERMAE